MKFLTQLWRFLRVAGLGAGAQVAIAQFSGSPLTKQAVAVIAVGAVEAAYRQLVPVREQSKIATLIAAVRAAYRQQVAAAATPATIPPPQA